MWNYGNPIREIAAACLIGRMTNMIDRKTILVTGATGAQGGSVAKHLLGSGQFNVRALTRKPDSDKARSLRNAGAEVVMGDLNDVRSLKDAVAGCQGVYGVTNFWEHFDREYDHGKNLIDTVAAADIGHLVFSSLPDARKLSTGTLDVPHFQMKAELEQYARDLELPATFVHVAFYYENFLYFFPPKQNNGGPPTFGFPQGDTPLAGVAAEDIGGVVAEIFKRPDEFIGKTVGIVGDDIQPGDYAAIMTRVLGREVVYNYIPRDVFAGFGFPGADDLANMFEMNRLHILERKADLELSRRLSPSIRAFEQWMKANRDKLLAAMAQ
jgi:uncharacterized protein YbjT (DUF2867 family)